MKIISELLIEVCQRFQLVRCRLFHVSLKLRVVLLSSIEFYYGQGSDWDGLCN